MSLLQRNRSTPTMREEASGKQKRTIDEKSTLRLNHLKNLAIWATKESSIPSLGCFYGRQFAAFGEGLCVAPDPDPSLFPCQRCETILQPGFNCKVRIEKNKAKKRRRRKNRVSSTENNVVYTCHFCSHRNLRLGTPKGHMKGISPAKLPSKPDTTRLPTEQTTASKTQGNETSYETSPVMSNSTEPDCTVTPPARPRATLLLDSKRKRKVSGIKKIADPEISLRTTDTEKTSVTDCPVTPPVKPRATLLLDSKRKRKASGLKKTTDPENSISMTDNEKTSEASRKRRRKSWMTLKEIAQSSEHERNQKISSVVVPCVL